AFVNTIISGAAFLNTFPGRRLMVSNYIPATGTLRIIFWGVSGAPSATSTIPIRWFAIGRWK
ncbi:hypothetical protein, partial [Cloacibacillus sp. An23]|uniref:hypothetical protein n=1 Tax=Cloacibacillus sp. An23 TaxID=1965591 RepID=UPI00195157D8